MKNTLLVLGILVAACLAAGCDGTTDPADASLASDAAAAAPDAGAATPDAGAATCLPQAAACDGSGTSCCEPFTCGNKKRVCCSIGGVQCESVEDCCGAPLVGGIGWA